MANLVFSLNSTWKGIGKDGEGTTDLAQNAIVYSAPASMGGKGVGTSPEELLIAAISSCYSGTLFAILRKEGLPVDEVKIHATGTVENYPLQSKFAQLCVSPTIYGGNPSLSEEYKRLSEQARDKCFIGKTIVGNVSYVVGEVTVISAA